MFQICHSIQNRKFYIQIECYYTYLKAVYFYINVHESHNINISWQPATQVYLYWIYMLKNIHVNKTQQSVYVFNFFRTINSWQFIVFSSTFHRITTLIYCFLNSFVNWSTSMLILLYRVWILSILLPCVVSVINAGCCQISICILNVQPSIWSNIVSYNILLGIINNFCCEFWKYAN